ncbi:hypothetical protein [Microbacterium sp. gxy059]|uniref:hypothetical protein n=1 Tax=Microbacterium sp. gxy059 TaxID=2957199 RepID=UPI003D9881E2
MKMTQHPAPDGQHLAVAMGIARHRGVNRPASSATAPPTPPPTGQRRRTARRTDPGERRRHARTLLEALVQAAMDADGRLDVFVADTDAAQVKPLFDSSSEEFQESLNIDISDSFRLYRHTAQQMVA